MMQTEGDEANQSSCEKMVLEFRPPGTEIIPYHEYLLDGGFIIEHESQLDQIYEQLKEHLYAAVIFNVCCKDGLPFPALGQLRQNFPRAIFVFTQTFETIDRILAYELGVDDFLTDQISPRELTTRIRAGIRRYSSSNVTTTEVETAMDRAGIHLDPASRTVALNGKEIELTRAEFDLLAILMGKPRQVFTRSLLLESLTQNGYQALDRTVDVHIASLRRKLGDCPQKPRYIRTARGLGYSFAQ